MGKNNNKDKQEIKKSKVSVFCTWAIEALWLFLLVAMPLFYYRSHQSFNMPKSQLLCITVILMLVFWIVKGLEEKKFSFKWDIFSWLGFGFLGIIGLSTIFSYFPSSSWWGSYVRFEGMINYMWYGIAYLLIYWNLRGFDQIKRIFIFAGIGVIPVAVYGFFQWYGYDFLEFMGSTDAGERFRFIISTLGNQLELSDYLVVTLPLILTLIFISKKYYFKILWAIVAILNVSALFLTGRRSGLVALAAIVFFGILFLAWRWKKGIAIALLILAILSGVLFFTFLEEVNSLEFVQNNDYLKRLTTIFDFEDVTIKERFLVWQISYDMILGRPIIGHGLETYKMVFDLNYPPSFTEMPENYFDRAHNIILDTAFKFGFVGLALFLAWLGLAVFQSLRLFFKEKKLSESYLGYGITLSIIAFMAHNQFMFESGTSRYILMVVLAVAGTFKFATISLKKEIEETDEPKKITENNDKLKFWAHPEFKILYILLLIGAIAYGIKFHVFPIAGDYRYNVGLSIGDEKYFKNRIEAFNQAIYYMPDVRSTKYHRRIGGDTFIYAQHVDVGLVDSLFGRSTASYERAIKINPNEMEAPAELGEIYVVWSAYAEDEALKQERLAEGEKYFNQAIALSPGRQMMYWDWGRSLMFAEETEEAIAKYLHAVEMAPEVGRSWFMLGKAYRNMGEPEKAREAFDKARELGYSRGSEDDPL